MDAKRLPERSSTRWRDEIIRYAKTWKLEAHSRMERKCMGEEFALYSVTIEVANDKAILNQCTQHHAEHMGAGCSGSRIYT